MDIRRTSSPLDPDTTPFQGWQTSTVQDDIQLCDFFLSQQKRSIVANNFSEFHSRIDKRDSYKAHEIEHLFWLFADPISDRVELNCPVMKIKENLMLLSQLTHRRIRPEDAGGR